MQSYTWAGAGHREATAAPPELPSPATASPLTSQGAVWVLALGGRTVPGPAPQGQETGTRRVASLWAAVAGMEGEQL